MLNFLQKQNFIRDLLFNKNISDWAEIMIRWNNYVLQIELLQNNQ